MVESLQWIVDNFDKFTIGSFLAVQLILVIFGLQRGWIVPGKYYRECIADRNKFEAKVEEHARATNEQLRGIQDDIYRKFGVQLNETE